MTHDACAPLALVSAAASDLQLQGMDDAQMLWRDRGAPALGTRADTTLEVRFESAAPAFFGLYDDQQRVIFVNSKLMDRTQLQIVIAHELGHAFGLLHVEDRDSVMNPGNLTIAPNAEDQAALAELWGTCQ
jgi:hypothetical protein